MIRTEITFVLGETEKSNLFHQLIKEGWQIEDVVIAGEEEVKRKFWNMDSGQTKLMKLVTFNLTRNG